MKFLEGIVLADFYGKQIFPDPFVESGMISIAGFYFDGSWFR